VKVFTKCPYKKTKAIAVYHNRLSSNFEYAGIYKF